MNLNYTFFDGCTVHEVKKVKEFLETQVHVVHEVKRVKEFLETQVHVVLSHEMRN